MKKITLNMIIYSIVFCINTLHAQEIEIIIPDTVAKYGETIDLPIILENISESDKIVAYQFDLNYNHEVLQALGASNENTISSHWDNPVINNLDDGVIRVGCYHTDYLIEEGTLVFIKFRVVGTPMDTSSLKISFIRLNNINLEDNVKSGHFTVDAEFVNIVFTNNLSAHIQILIDGEIKETPVDTMLILGSEHVVDVPSPQSRHDSVRYLFQEWSDSGSQCHTIQPFSDINYEIFLKKQFYVDTKSNLEELVSINGDGWYDQDESVNISAPEFVQEDTNHYVFDSWEVNGNEFNENTISITVDTSYRVIAKYNNVYYIKGEIDYEGIKLSNVQLILSSQFPDTISSDSLGEYQFNNVESAYHVITPVLEGFEFYPHYREYWKISSNLNDQDFTAIDTMKPTITLLYPNGGEKLKISSSDSIMWIASDNSMIENINIHYSLNSGETWKSIFNGNLEHQKFIWTTPDSITDQLKIKVTVIDKSGNYAYDQSDACFSTTGSTSVVDKSNEFIPTQFRLFPNYPNPFNGNTIISFQLPESANVFMRIFNIYGQEIATLVNKNMEAGNYSTIWDGRDKNGKTVSSGIYFFQLQAAKYVNTKRMLYLK